MTAPLTRREKIELYAALQEQHRRRELARVATERGVIVANCSTLYGFIQEFWYVLEPARPFVGGWALRAMCDHLEAVTRGDIRFLLMNVPPGMMKSLLLVFWPAWEWGPKNLAHMQFLATSFSQPNVLRDNAKMRRLVQSEKYQALWPTKFRPDQDAKGKYENLSNGFREGRPFTAMTGGRADRVLVDDPHSVDGAESEAERENAVQTFREGITDRMNDVAKSAIVIIMQRLHEKDVSGEVLALDLGFVHLSLPMEFDPDRRCVTPIFTDPRTQKDELLFPERFPAAEVARLKKAKGSYAWSGQYQQAPTPRGGGLFKREWFQIVGAVPAKARRVRKWDLAATEDTGHNDPDWTVGLLMAQDMEGFYYVEDVVRLRGSPAKVEEAVVNTAKLDDARFGMVPVSLNQDPGQAGKAQISYLTRKLAGHIVSAERETGDKATRAAGFASQAEAGNVRVVNAPWLMAYLDEVCTFPKGAHDDQVDASSGAFGELLQGFDINLFMRANG